VQAIAAAGILMFSSYPATTAFGGDASSVPDSALKGKKVAYVACSDLNRWRRDFMSKSHIAMYFGK
jgi:hypothetical protein